MARMVRRHYSKPHRFICFTDQVPIVTHYVSDDVPYALAPLWSDYADLPHPCGQHNPSCYRRLRLYSNWARERIGPRIVQIDLDMVITGDLRPLWDRPDAFAFWSDQLNRHGRINGAMQLITPGLRDDIWSAFDPPPRGRSGASRVNGARIKAGSPTTSRRVATAFGARLTGLIAGASIAKLTAGLYPLTPVWLTFTARKTLGRCPSRSPG